MKFTPQEESNTGEGGSTKSAEFGQLHSQNSSLESQQLEALDGVQVLEKSRASQLFEDMLTTYYTPMEVWYARSVIDKVKLHPAILPKSRNLS